MPFQNIVVPCRIDVPLSEIPNEARVEGVNYGSDGTVRQNADTIGLRLQWSKGETGHVSIASCRMIAGYPGGYMPEESHLMNEALWSSLDRLAINELIKTLRQARDDAFGKDA